MARQALASLEALEKDLEILWPYLHLAAANDLVSPLLSNYQPTIGSKFHISLQVLQVLQRATNATEATRPFS